MTVSIRMATAGDADLEAIAAIVTLVSPEEPTSVDELIWADRTYPGGARYLAESRGVAVGAATIGRIYMYPPDFPALWATIDVVPAARRLGTGTLLLRAVSEHARRNGKPELHIPVSEARPESVAFLRNRGFTEYERAKSVELSLDGLTPPEVRPPEGVAITSLGARPDLVDGVHRVATESFADIPGGETPMAVGDLAEFRARDIDRPLIPLDAFMVATDTASGLVIGYASLILAPGTVRRLAWHDMTAVLRAWRGRGVAAALKRATIRWAIDHGLDVLQTGNDVDNAAMRAVNGRLGYRPLPDLLTMRGPLFDGIMAT